MTPVVAGVCLTLSLILGAAQVDAAHASTLQARAEAAADSAALAAVAESGPYGSGNPSAMAHRYASLNSAKVLECKCGPGSLSATVTVAVGPARATSRAVFDPSAMSPASVASGLNPRLAAAVTRLLAASGGRVSLVSGFRSYAEQSRLWRQAVARYGSSAAADDWVAPPGGSMHQRGLAVDLGGDVDLAVRLIRRLDLPMWRPLPNEPWHFELAGSRG